MKRCMTASVFPHSVGTSLVRDLLLAWTGYNRLMIRYVRFVRTCWLLRVDRRAMQISDGTIWSLRLVTRFFSRCHQWKALFDFAVARVDEWCASYCVSCISVEEVFERSRAEDGGRASDYWVGFDYWVSSDSSQRVMRNRTIKYVKVLWTNQSEREGTWELEDPMRQKYPELFESSK